MNQSLVKIEEESLNKITIAQDDIINTCQKVINILNERLDNNKNKISNNQLIAILKSLSYTLNLMQSVRISLSSQIFEMKEIKIFDSEEPQKIEREIKISGNNPEESLKKLQEAMLKINEKWHKQ